MSCATGLVGVTDRLHNQLRAHQTTAGTMRSAELRPELPAHLFPPPSSQKQDQQPRYKKADSRSIVDIPEEQGASTLHTSPETLEDDEFGADYFKDQEVMNSGKTACSTSNRVECTDYATSQKHGF